MQNAKVALALFMTRRKETTLSPMEIELPETLASKQQMPEPVHQPTAEP